MTVRTDTARPTRFGSATSRVSSGSTEANYVRLAKLIPDLPACDRAMVSRVAGALDLHLGIIERQPYTTSLVLTYRFPDGGECVLEPNARINVYHDVRAAEIVSHSRRRVNRSVSPWTPGRMPELDRKWRMNRFLVKWLRFCTYQGHIFLSRGDSDPRPGGLGANIQPVHAPASPHRLTPFAADQRSVRAGTGGMRSVSRVGRRPRRCS